MRVLHILVKHKYEAEDILRLLKQGRSFESLAQKLSICSSASRGGDLGTFRKDSVDPDFLEALMSLKAGETSGAVRTRFGYHIITKRDNDPSSP